MITLSLIRGQTAMSINRPRYSRVFGLSVGAQSASWSDAADARTLSSRPICRASCPCIQLHNSHPATTDSLHPARSLTALCVLSILHDLHVALCASAPLLYNTFNLNLVAICVILTRIVDKMRKSSSDLIWKLARHTKKSSINVLWICITMWRLPVSAQNECRQPAAYVCVAGCIQNEMIK